MNIAFIGFGEAGSALVKGWGSDQPGDIAAYDIKLDDPSKAPEIYGRCDEHGVRCCGTLAELLSDAEIVFCTVTADQAVAAATAAAPHIASGTLFLDLNSCAPSSKQKAAKIIEAAGGRFVDVAVMSPVYPKLNMVPLLIGGPHAEDAEPLLRSLPLASEVLNGPVGAASSVKMIRSIMVKGMEALTAECVLAAVAAGVEDEVLASLKDGHPKIDVATRAAYNFERSLAHGERRAAEMEEVAVTISDLGLPNAMARGSVEWQRLIGRSGVSTAASDPQDYRLIAEALLPKLQKD